MANTLPPNPQAAAAEVQQQNADIARRLEDQGREYDNPAAIDDTGSALDDLARQASGEGTDDGQQGSGEGADGGAAGGASDGADGGHEGSADDNAGAGEGASGDGENGDLVTGKDDDDSGNAGDGTEGGRKPDADGDGDGAGGTPDDGAAGDAGSDPFKDHKLPDTATPKSAEAFELVKTKAREQIQERDTKITDLTKQLEELKSKVDQGLPPEAKQELEELREFRTKLDIEVDPQYKAFDQKIASAADFVYAQLEKAGIGKDVVAKIKEFGGPHKVNMDKILATVDDKQVERLVNSKVADIEQADFDKKQAIEKAKANVGEYLKERQEQMVKGAGQHRQVTQQILDKEILPKFEFFKEPKAPKADASEDEKKLYGAQKEWYQMAKNHVEQILSDDSPQMRAIMAGGVVKMLHLQTVAEAQKRIISDRDAAIAKITKERDEAMALTNRLKKGSVSQRTRSNSTGSQSAPVTGAYDPNQPTEDALDALAKRVGQERRSGVS